MMPVLFFAHAHPEQALGGPDTHDRGRRYVSNKLDTLPGGVEGAALHKKTQPSIGAARVSSRCSRN